MKKRIFHKILIPALVIMLMTPFYFTQVKADTFNDNYSVTTRVDFIKGTTQNGGYYDYHSVITTTVNFKMEYTGTFRLRTDGVNPIYVTGRATVDGAELLYVSDQGTYVDFQCTYCKEFTYTQSYDYRIGYSMNIYGSALEGSYANGTMIQYIDGIEEQLSQIKIYIDGVETSLNDIKNTINKLETVEWNDIYYVPLFSNSLNGTYSNSTYVEGHDVFVKMTQASTILYNHDPIYKIRLPVKYISTENRFFDSLDIKIYGVSGNTYTLADYELITYSTYYNYINLYFKMFNNCYDYVIHFHDDNYIIAGSANTSQSYGQYITEDVIDYWEIYNVLNQKSFYIKILDSLNNFMQGDSNSNSVVNNNNNLNQQLQTSVNQYDQVENQFKESFSTSMNQISKPDLSNIVSAAAWYTTQLTSLFNASGSFQIIYVLPLVLGIALFFIGRGAVALRQSSNQETHWVETIKDENGFTTRHGTIRSETVRGKGRYK